MADELFKTVLDIVRSAQPKLDPRDPDHTRKGIFVYHNCWRCWNGKRPCVNGSPNRCDIPHARND